MLTRRQFAGAAAFASTGRLRLTHLRGEKVTIHSPTATLLEYRYSPARPKTYIHPLCTPSGRPITLDSPHDHIHHRGLMLAWSEVNDIDFWGEVNPARHGQILHQRFERLRHSPAVELVSLNHWVAEGQLLLVERRTIRVTPPRDGAGVALFDDPSNPRHPNPFFVMNKAFGYLSAAPTFHAPFQLERGQSIRFHWGVLAFDGAPQPHLLERRFSRWAGSNR
jgi:hypothetical protein